MQVLVSGQESILNRVFGVVWVAHIAIGPDVERGQITRNSVLELRCVLFANMGDCVPFICDIHLLSLHVVYASLPTTDCTTLAKHPDTGCGVVSALYFNRKRELAPPSPRQASGI